MKKTDYKLFNTLKASRLLLVVLAGAIFAMNFCKHASYCALLCTTAAYTLHLIAVFHGYRQAFYSLAGIISMSLVFLYKQKYFLYGQFIPGLIVASLSTILVAGYVSLNFFIKLRRSYCLSFSSRNAISMGIFVLTDLLLMTLFISRFLSINQLFPMVIREVRYKCTAILAIYLAVMLCIHLKSVWCSRYSLNKKPISSLS